MKWISVNDRLPENEENVLVYIHCDDCSKNIHHEHLEFMWQWNPWRQIIIGHYFKETEIRKSGWTPINKVTHWMPLPEFPKMDEK